MPMEEPAFSLQLFCKVLPPVEWRYFPFHEQADLSMDVEAPVDSDGDGESDASDSSGSSSSSSSSGSPVVSKPKHAPVEVADEVIGALHRLMWHVALDAMDPAADTIRTACGRKFPRGSITAISDLRLEPGQSLCSHVGCRKGWRAVGAF